MEPTPEILEPMVCFEAWLQQIAPSAAVLLLTCIAPAGGNGTQGDAGGSIFLYVASSVDGTLILSADGGTGGAGQMGGNGAKGVDGQEGNASTCNPNDTPTCISYWLCPQDGFTYPMNVSYTGYHGGSGSNGGRGGDSGNNAPGGAGGSIRLHVMLGAQYIASGEFQLLRPRRVLKMMLA